LDKRDQILAKLAVGLGLVDKGGYQRAAQLMVQFPGRSFDRILLDTKLIDARQHKALVDAYNQRLAQHRQTQQAPARPALEARGLSGSDVLLPSIEEDPEDDEDDLDLSVPGDRLRQDLSCRRFHGLGVLQT
jgi:hypothetical protein